MTPDKMNVEIRVAVTGRFLIDRMKIRLAVICHFLLARMNIVIPLTLMGHVLLVGHKILLARMNVEIILTHHAS